MATATPALTVEVALDAQVLDVTSEMFFQMIDAGVFSPERRVFLWAGRLYEKMAKTPAHATTFVRIADTLRPYLPADWLIWPENPIALDARHAPLPDVTFVRGPLERYHQEDRHPQISEVSLMVEIAVTSLPRDLTLRAEKFARRWYRPIGWPTSRATVSSSTPLRRSLTASAAMPASSLASAGTRSAWRSMAGKSR